MRVATTTRIACPPERVFDILADLRNDTEWNSRVTSAELQNPEPIGQGSRFALVNGGSEYDVTITTYERPSRLVYEASGNPDLTIACSFTPTEEGTELDSDFDFRPKGPLKVLFPLLGPVIRRDVPKQYASLKALCERSA
ncbi:MAG TPA: SRPBCC family protein [Gaiellaceae bacterium]|nr:SRPBCC family protein [Gaiellaceae bacterium]